MQKFGYAPTGYNPGNISETTEYGLDDWNLAQLAAALGKKDDAAKYQQQSASYKLIFDPNAPGPMTPPARMRSRNGKAGSAPRTPTATS